MAINKQLFKALLAMDSYNRGDVSKLGLPSTTTNNIISIGNATLLDNSDNTGQTGSGFFAQSYKDNATGEITISYRGTDNITQDMITGWTTGGGAYASSQALLAGDFYNAVVGEDNLFTANVSLTGHSLGGGLAGLIGSVYGKEATLFDNMPYELSTDGLYKSATEFAATPAEVYLSELVADSYYAGNNDLAQLPDSSNITAYATTGEMLASIRVAQDQEVTYLDSTGGVRSPIDLHSQALLVTLMFADTEVASSDWKNIGSAFIDSLFNDAVGLASGSKNADHMLNKIAYSVIDEGTRIFGDTAIRSLFNDANDFGKIVGAGMSDILASKADFISNIFVQYSGLLAENKIMKGVNPEVLNGVLNLSADSNALTLNFDSSIWATAGLTNLSNIIGRNDLINDLYSTKVSSSLTPISNSDIGNIIFITKEGASTTVSDAAANGKFNIIAGSSSADTIIGSNGDDIILGFGGPDRNQGVDMLYGGAGDDVLKPGANDNYIKQQLAA